MHYFFGAFSARISQNQRVAIVHARSTRFFHNLVMSLGEKSCSGRLRRQLRSTPANLGDPLCNAADQLFRRTHTEIIGEVAWVTQYFRKSKQIATARSGLSSRLTLDRFRAAPYQTDHDHDHDHD